MLVLRYGKFHAKIMLQKQRLFVFNVDITVEQV